MVDRDSSNSSVIDLLDCVLGKGIVIDSSAQESLAGIELLSAESRVVVASIAVNLSYAPEIPDSLHPHVIVVERRATGTINLSGWKRRADDRRGEDEES
jgi:hypothetical protein